MVGPTEEQCILKAEKEGWTLGRSQGNFRANSKALAEGEGAGIAKVLFKKETGEVVAVHIIGLHAADLIQECANAIAAGTTVQELAMMVVRSSVFVRVAVCRCGLDWLRGKVRDSHDFFVLIDIILKYSQNATSQHTHPTLSEVMDEAFKGAVGMSSH